MRELKFRIWDTKDKKFINGIPPKEYMLDPDSEWSHHDISDDPCVYINRVFTQTFEGRLVFQQYTGLKDKNGKDIYEGDIIKFEKIVVGKTYNHCDFKNPIFGEPKTITWIGEVVFDKITDCDDFYTPTMLAWGVKNKDYISSLCGKIEEHNPELLYDGSYWKSISQNWEIIGNIFENPELLA